VPLLFETGVRNQMIDCIEVDYRKAFFQTKGDFPFDVLAASFYLISRYEEYLPHQKDEYGRFAHTSSLAHREQFLNVPLVNLWLESLRKKLKAKFPTLIFRRRSFKFIATYDIDIAWSYKHKGWARNLGGFLKNLSQGKWSQLSERIAVLRGKQADPYDCYEWLDALHLYCRIKPVYFFLVAQKLQGYDRNIATSSKALQKLINYCAGLSKTGVHPSWQSSVAPNHNVLLEEKEWMEAIIDKPAERSRQHYIKLSLPETYRRLISCGLLKDYSMGYGSTNGFRASVASSFLWFDLEKNETTPLRIYPFCFMDANSYYELGHSARDAYEELMQYYNTLKKLNGLFIIIWHNHFLGSDKNFKTWKEMYELFLKENIYWDAYIS
jgi:hypothetical protein